MKWNTLKDGEALVLCSCDAAMTSNNGFTWPREGPVTAPVRDLEHGFHGFLWGEGDPSLASKRKDTQWILCKVVETNCEDTGRDVVFYEGAAVFVGTRDEAVKIITHHMPLGRRCNWAVQNAGEKALQMAGDYAVQVGGEYSKQKAGHHAVQNAGRSNRQIAENDAIQVGGFVYQMAADRAIQTGGVAQQEAGNNAMQTARSGTDQTAGDNATQTGGDRSKQWAGDNARQTAGKRSVQNAGNDSVLFAGVGSRCRAGVGSVIKICYQSEADGRVKFAMSRVSESGPVKPGIFYTVNNEGVFMEADDQEFPESILFKRSSSREIL